jgi:carbamoyl-phosphate synthase large subunit
MVMGNILISSAGRRVGLVACFRDSIAVKGTERKVLTIDSSSSAPAAFIADGGSRVPHCTDHNFVDDVIQFCVENDVQLLIPTIDTELPVYASALQSFSASGVIVSLSSPETVEVCCNKARTNEWLLANGFPTVRQTDPITALLNPSAWPTPLIAKPYNGSAAVGMRRVETLHELESIAEMSGGYIIQEIATGREYTINVYVNRSGKCICTVPHWRMEVRAGEVSKGITVKDPRLCTLARRISEALPGAYGPMNIQCFMDLSGGIKVIEINARFGGGYPLTHRAGARFTDWLLDELEGRPLSDFDSWTDDLAMLRYDEAIFVPGSAIQLCEVTSVLSSISTTRCT